MPVRLHLHGHGLLFKWFAEFGILRRVNWGIFPGEELVLAWCDVAQVAFALVIGEAGTRQVVPAQVLAIGDQSYANAHGWIAIRFLYGYFHLADIGREQHHQRA